MSKSLQFRVPVALLMFSVPLALTAQSSSGSFYGDGQSTQQSTPSNCTDSSGFPIPGCSQQNQPNIVQQPVPEGTQPRGGQTLGNPAQEAPGATTPFGQQAGTRNRPVQQFPPDQPTEFQRFVAATTGQMLPIYGASLFRNVPSTFSPSEQAPATPQYVIEPDDELRVRIWGQVNFSGNLLVDRSGNIYIPQVGSVHVAGQPFSALDLHLRQAIGRIFRNFDVSVDLGRIRSMQVYVTGVARTPGVYTVSSLSTLVDALFASGGPSPQGSLRHIQLKRAGKVEADFDLYALLIEGDKSHDVQLLPEDVIYIPPAGPQVAITGSIRTPAIYELRDHDTLGSLIDAAGKTSAVASQSRISIERLDHQQYRQAMEVTFDTTGLATPLSDGDILRIYPTLPAYQKTVTLRGNVANPGRFGWHQGMRLSDLIPDKASLLSRDYWWQRSHLGLPSQEFEPFISAQRGLVGTDPALTIPVTGSTGITGYVLTPGAGSTQNYQQGYPQDLSQGYPQSYQQGYQQPVQPTDPTRQGLPQGPAGSSGSLAAQGGAQGVNRQENEPPTKKNTVRLTPQEINWDYAVVERTDPDTLKTSLIPFDLGKLVLNHDDSQNLALLPGDAITIFSQTDIQIPLEQQTKYIYLEGEFAHAGAYSVQPGETLRDVIRRAGGLTKNAYLYGSEFDRESTRKLQQQRLDEYVRTVSLEADRGTQQLAVTGTGAGASTDVLASRQVAQQLVDKLSQVRATGRIVLQFQPANANLDDVPALSLENGDRFTVPPVPLTVNVVGAVYNQNTFIYRSGQTVSHYMRLAGGPNRNADNHYAFVIRADGSVISRPTVRSSFGVMGVSGFESLRLNPGDTIVVPDKTLRPTRLRNIMDWTQVFSQLALGAAAINVL